MSDHLPYIPLDILVTDYLNESEQSITKYFKIWHLLFRCLEDLGLDFFYRVPTFKLPVNANFTVTLPAGTLNWIKIGIENDRGGIITLQENNNMNSYASLLPDRIMKVNDPQSLGLQGGTNLWGNYWNGSGYTVAYGVPSGEPFVGEFKVDIENGVILLNENFQRDYLIVQCVVSPQVGGEYYVPMQFRESMIAWAWWKDKRAVNVKRGMVGIGRDLERMYYNERRKGAAKWNPVRQSQIYQSSQQLTRLAVKS